MGQILKKLLCENCCRCCCWLGEEVDWEEKITEIKENEDWPGYPSGAFVSSRSLSNENVAQEVKSTHANVNTFENPDVSEEANTTIPEDLPEPLQVLSEEKSKEKGSPNDDSVLPSDNVTDLVTQNLVKMDDDDEDKKDVDQKDLKKNDAGDSVLSVGDGDPNTPSDKVTDLVTDHLDTKEEKNGAIEEEKIDPSFTVVDKADSDAPNNDI